ncbi:MAG: glycosyl transferase family 1 [Chitinophaga sp.]|nr:glycosyl transferase family 1 [Chitinophaga sp.]
MKILLVHNQYSTTGGEDQALAREKAMLIQWLGEENIFEYSVSVNDYSKWQILRSIFYSRTQYRNVYDLVKQHQIDIVHVHNYFPVLTASVFKAAKAAGAKLVHTVHNYRWWCISGNFYRPTVGICTLCVDQQNFWNGIKHRCYRNSFLQSLVAKLAYAYYKKIGVFEWIDQFWVLTQFQYQQLIKLGVPVDKLQLKPNILDPATIQALPNAQRSGFLYIGRLDAEKGIEYILSEWVKLSEQYQLTIIGSGSLETALKSQYNQPNIIFTGALPFDQVNQYLQKAQYTLQPSLWYETMGLTIIESMQQGTPVIGFNIGTRPELIEHGKTGFICTPHQFIRTIQLAAHYPDDDYDAMVMNARAFAQNFAPDLIMAQQLHLYENLLSQ